VFLIDRLTTGSMQIPASAFTAASIWTGDAFYGGSGPPTSSLLLRGWSVPVPLLMPDTLATAQVYGWGAHAETPPTSAFNIQIALNDTLAATLTMNTNGTFGYTSASGLAWIVNVRDRLTAIAPSVTDATINNFFFTIAGAVT
jgi:hypothetical protein